MAFYLTQQHPYGKSCFVVRCYVQIDLTVYLVGILNATQYEITFIYLKGFIPVSTRKEKCYLKFIKQKLATTVCFVFFNKRMPFLREGEEVSLFWWLSGFGTKLFIMLGTLCSPPRVSQDPTRERDSTQQLINVRSSVAVCGSFIILSWFTRGNNSNAGSRISSRR